MIRSGNTAIRERTQTDSTHYATGMSETKPMSWNHITSCPANISLYRLQCIGMICVFKFVLWGNCSAEHNKAMNNLLCNFDVNQKKNALQ